MLCPLDYLVECYWREKWSLVLGLVQRIEEYEEPGNTPLVSPTPTCDYGVRRKQDGKPSPPPLPRATYPLNKHKSPYFDLHTTSTGTMQWIESRLWQVYFDTPWRRWKRFQGGVHPQCRAWAELQFVSTARTMKKAAGSNPPASASLLQLASPRTATSGSKIKVKDHLSYPTPFSHKAASVPDHWLRSDSKAKARIATPHNRQPALSPPAAPWPTRWTYLMLATTLFLLFWSTLHALQNKLATSTLDGLSLPLSAARLRQPFAGYSLYGSEEEGVCIVGSTAQGKYRVFDVNGRMRVSYFEL